MKVVNIHPVMFKANKSITKPDDHTDKYNQIKELPHITPSFTVRAPQKYSNLGVTELPNGLKAYSYKLANGHRVTVVPMEGSPATVKNYVNVGSMNETDDIKGISHFLEHMAFNGTNGKDGYIKLNTGDSFKKIDKLGGWTNASTNYALTDYVNSTPMLEEKDLEEQIKIIAGMTEDLALTPEMIEKEKAPVCSEINMIMDNPQTILTDQTVRTLFNIKSSADELVGGSTQHIKNLTREKVKDYYDKHYTPDNMNLVITGDVSPDKVMKLVAKNFHSTKTSKGPVYEEKLTPLRKTKRKDFINNKAKSTDIMLGFVGPKNNDTKSKIIFDILSEHLFSTDAGLNKEFKKINASQYIGLEKISTNPNNPRMIYYTVDCADENSEKALKIIFDKLSSIKSPSDKKLEIIKERLLRDYKEAFEYSRVVNDVIGNSIIDGEFNDIANQENIIKSITTDDINNFIKQYINLDKTAITVVHPEVSKDSIYNNYEAAKSLSFKGKRQAINLDKVSETTLNNNYKIGFYETNSDNVNFDISLKFKTPDNVKPAVRVLYDEILTMGTMNSNEEEFQKYQEENNISVYAYTGKETFGISGNSSQENFTKTAEKVKELLYSPRITQEELNKALERLKDSLARRRDTASRIYAEYEAKNNPYYISEEELLKDLDSVTLDDIKNFHEYIINNSTGIIAANTPANNKQMKNIIQNNFENFSAVKPYKYTRTKAYKENSNTIVLTKEKEASQADISEVFKFKFEDNVKERAMLEIMNTILSSSSIGLFTVLREKEHLAYSVHSNTNIMGDCAELSCNILTTTDNKEIGEISYDNLQKSINGFNRQIGALLNSEYTDDDLESAKRVFKAKLLNKEGSLRKISALNNGLDSLEGIDFENKLMDAIDTITRADIDAFTRKVFSNPPTYAIVASKDTLEANKDYLASLKK